MFLQISSAMHVVKYVVQYVGVLQTQFHLKELRIKEK